MSEELEPRLTGHRQHIDCFANGPLFVEDESLLHLLSQR